MQPEPSSAQEQPVESFPVQEPQVEPVVIVSKPSEKNKFKTMFFILLTFFIMTFACLSIWAILLNARLKATEAALADLQVKHDTLAAEKQELSVNLDLTTSDLEAARTDLENTRTELSQTQSDLAKVTEEKTELRARMDKAGLWMKVAIAFIVTDERESSIEKKVVATGDAKLKQLWDEFVDTPFDINNSQKLDKWIDALNEFEGYLLESIANMLE